MSGSPMKPSMHMGKLAVVLMPLFNHFGARRLELTGAALFCRVLLERLVGLLLQRVGLELSIEIVELAELLENPIDLCHLQASQYQPDPASSPWSA